MVVNHILQKNCKVYTKNVRLHKNKKRSLCDLPMEKNSEVNRRGRDKKLPLGGGGFGVNGRRPLSQLGGSTYAGEPGVTDCHGRRAPSQ